MNTSSKTMPHLTDTQLRQAKPKVVIRRLERDIFPWIGDRIINEITVPELLAVLRQVEGRGALETAHRELKAIGWGNNAEKCCQVSQPGA
jgi:hypothetical protein